MAESPEPEVAADAADLDPELLKLSKPRTRVGWLLSLAVVVLCVFWGLRLRSDLVFSRQSSSPTLLDGADAALAAPTDHYVALDAVPDRARVARVWVGAELGSHVAPALGSAGKLWILTPASAYQGEPGRGERYVGRLQRLGDMPFFDQLSAYYAGQTPVLEPLAPGDVAKALASGAATVPTAHGDAISVSGDQKVEVRRRVAGVARIIAMADADHFAAELAWRDALQKAQILPLGGQPITGSATSWTYEVPAPEGLEAIRDRLRERGLFGARVIPVERVYTASWSALHLKNSELTIAGSPMPLEEVSAVAVAYRPPVPADAVVVVTGEKPADYWYILPLLILFGALGLLFTWTLIRAVRGGLPPTPAPGNVTG